MSFINKLTKFIGISSHPMSSTSLKLTLIGFSISIMHSSKSHLPIFKISFKLIPRGKNILPTFLLIIPPLTPKLIPIPIRISPLALPLPIDNLSFIKLPISKPNNSHSFKAIFPKLPPILNLLITSIPSIESLTLFL